MFLICITKNYEFMIMNYENKNIKTIEAYIDLQIE